ncbi:MAG TPA: heme-binding protein [Candidatus Dormibacteraeota bacterium]|nr:heme-binding protein [Candidatus Dormibacteraeota bacterium]
MELTLADAQKAVARAQAKAAELDLRITVAVVDAGGLLVALGRMDGAPPISPQIAEAKAVGAAMFLRDGGWLGQTAQDRPGFFKAADRLARLPLIPGPGSALVKRGGAVIGAVGVSGARPEQDLECAEAGAASVQA